MIEKHEIEGPLLELEKNIKDACTTIALDNLESEKLALEAEMNMTDFWNDQVHAQEVVGEYKRVKFLYDTWSVLANDMGALRGLFDVAFEHDLEVVAEELERIQQAYDHASFLLYFKSPHDKEPAVLTITSGVGGDDAEDFSGMLLRMYSMYCERQGLDYDILEITDGAGSDGIKKAVMEIRGPFAYGTLKGEKGVHRLVRLSPFKSSDSRQTSFAHVEVMPLMSNISKDDIDIDEKDLRIDTFRSSGKGGQKVNKTDSAVRLTHIPTGLVAACQVERSQHQNKDRALAMLKSKLFHLKQTQFKKEKENLQGEVILQDWGKQIRSYVLHPYKLVKDNRTDVETSKVDDVFNGDLEIFIDAEIKAGDKLYA